MKILAIDSSAQVASVAVLSDTAVLAEYSVDYRKTHSQTLLPMIDEVLRMTETAKEDIDAIAVAAGPGSFTGLRIGVSALKGLAWAADRPCVGVSTLNAMARNLAHLDGALLVCAMDARRNQVYNALFEAKRGTLERLTSDRAVGLDELAEELAGDAREKVLLGDGAALAYGYLTERGVPCTLAPAALRYQDAVGVALAAETMEPVPAQALGIQYLRVSQAERERNARLRREAEQ